MVHVVVSEEMMTVIAMVHVVASEEMMTVIVMVHVVGSAEMMETIGTEMRVAGAAVPRVDHLHETGMKVVVMTDPHLVLNLPEVMKEAVGDLQDHLNVMTGLHLLETTVHHCGVEMIEDLQEE